MCEYCESKLIEMGLIYNIYTDILQACLQTGRPVYVKRCDSSEDSKILQIVRELEMRRYVVSHETRTSEIAILPLVLYHEDYFFVCNCRGNR